MICPYCKHEKLDAPSCPQCGLAEKEALLKAAGLYWTEGKQELAVDYYGRYLALEPGDFDVACKRASYLCSMAQDRRDPLLFEKADKQITQILQGHWDWQAGHQSRMDLYFCFGNLDSLLADYQKIAGQDPVRAARCVEVGRLIQLMMRFKEEQPEVPDSLKGESEASLLLKSFFPLILGIVFCLVYTAIYPISFSDSAGSKLAYFEVAFLGVAIMGLGILGIWQYQKGRKRAASKPRRRLEP